MTNNELDQRHKVFFNISIAFIVLFLGFLIVTCINKIIDTKVQIKLLEIKVNHNETVNKNLSIELNKLKRIYVTLTAYSLAKNQCNDDLENTAIMQKPIPGYTAAVSQDLSYLLGKKIYIKGHGVFYINDLMNKRYNKSIDILLGSKTAALSVGRQSLIEIVLI